MASKRKEWLQIGSGKSYFHRTHQPLQCLIFITPLLLIYQIGTAIQPFDPNQSLVAGSTRVDVVAFLLMLRFFSAFGAAGNYLPLLSVVAMLLSWHLARKDKWDFHPQLYGGMAAESLIWAIPIFVISLAVLQRAGAFAWLAAAELSVPRECVLAVGAGVYEELLFRLITITLLNMLLVDAFDLKVTTAIPIIIIVSALLFAAYHFLGTEGVSPAKFFFLTAFGVYCAGIFIFRGFGIAVGCHAVYDIIVVLYNHRH